MIRFVFATSALALAQGRLYHVNMSIWHVSMMDDFEQGAPAWLTTGADCWTFPWIQL